MWDRSVSSDPKVFKHVFKTNPASHVRYQSCSIHLPCASFLYPVRTKQRCGRAAELQGTAAGGRGKAPNRWQQTRRLTGGARLREEAGAHTPGGVAEGVASPGSRGRGLLPGAGLGAAGDSAGLCVRGAGVRGSCSEARPPGGGRGHGERARGARTGSRAGGG